MKRTMERDMKLEDKSIEIPTPLPSGDQYFGLISYVFALVSFNFYIPHE